MRLVTFEMTIIAVDQPTRNRRWNGEPMPSREANEALNDAVDAARKVLTDAGFTLARTGYGCRAQETDDGH